MNSLAIKIYYRDVKFRLGKTKDIKQWIGEVIRAEGKKPGDLSFIFVGDSEILEINREFLEHDYYTDVIAFDYCSGDIIEGEIYLSIDTIRRNAVTYSKRLKEEILRVMVHGTLHLTGYSDNDQIQKSRMSKEEDKYLEEYKEINNGL